MLLRDYTVNVIVPRCNPRAQTVSVIADLSDDIIEVMPYLNAAIKGCAYQPEAGVLRFYREGAAIDVRSAAITVTRVESEARAREILESLKELINTTYDRRDELDPSYEARNELKAIEVLRHLPGTNCKHCGAPSCFVFAARFVRREAKLEDCTPLFSPGHSQRKQKLLDLLRSAGYI
ncbi:MAG: Fe-S cluster protein [Chloroflexi bacterium]|nr:Fe-S cluster protein [Chloroflexota bacterium]